MSQIRFLHDFTASRVVRRRCILKNSDATTTMDEQGITFKHCSHRFRAGETDFVRRVLRGHAEGLLVITDNPVVGEVVLDNAKEGIDFEVIA